MPSRTVLALLTSFAFAGTAALAQDAPPPPEHMNHMMHMNKEDMGKHHAEMCTGLYAHAVGKFAELEVKLALTPQQKPLFEHWKGVKLASVKDRTDKCGKMQMPERDISLMDGVRFETAMLEARLADLKAQTPSLEALVNALSAEQQKVLERAAHKIMHERMGFMERMHGMRDRMHSFRESHHKDDGAAPKK